MILNTFLILAGFLSSAEARTIDVSFEEGETSPTLSRPETKREEKKREDLTSLKEEGSDSKESLLPSGESSKRDWEGEKSENLTSLQEEENDSKENPLPSNESSESSQEEKKQEDLTSLEEENDSIELLLPPSESSDPAGGGVRHIDQKFLTPNVPQPIVALPWWERWYLSAKQWILGPGDSCN